MAVDPLIELRDVNKYFGELHVLQDISMRQLAREGMIMIVVTHEMGFARSAAARAVFKADGRIVEDRTPEEFFTDPGSDRAKDFLSKILKY